MLATATYLAYARDTRNATETVVFRRDGKSNIILKVRCFLIMEWSFTAKGPDTPMSWSLTVSHLRPVSEDSTRSNEIAHLHVTGVCRAIPSKFFQACIHDYRAKCDLAIHNTANVRCLRRRCYNIELMSTNLERYVNVSPRRDQVLSSR